LFTAGGGAMTSPNTILDGRYVLEEHVDTGGMAEVWRAHDRSHDSVVAVKVLHDTTLSGRKRFSRESRMLRQLTHPAIVRSIDHGLTEAGRPYIVLEWLEGEDLRNRLEREPLPLAATVELARRVADALGAAHARGIVHRDVKPGNVFLVKGEVEQAKVLDFGVARWRQVGDLTRPGQQVGTPKYMAPEQALGAGTIDARADVFGLGCVMYLCITGTAPFVGHDLLEVLGKVLLAEVPPLRELVQSVPASLEVLVAKMLSKNREARPSDGAEVAQALAEIQLTLTGSADATPRSSEWRPATLTGHEQRVVSVVAARSGQHVDPDDTLADSESSSIDCVRVIATSLGAQLHRLADGSLVVLLPPMGMPTDQASRAARCALQTKLALGDLPVAVATGRAMLSDRLPVGEALERGGALLRSDSASRHVRIDQLTAGLLDARFEIAGDEQGLRLVAERAVTRPMRTLLGKPVPYVGRRREMATLQAVWSECIEEEVARAVVVVGAAGVGKSRLRHELMRELRLSGKPAQIVFARGDALSAGSALAMAAQMVRGAAGIQEGEPFAARQQKLCARVGRCVPQEHVQRVTEFLGELLATPFPDDDRVQLQAARRDSTLMGDQIRRAFEDLVEADCSSVPMLLILEDLHDGDRATAELVDRVLRNLGEVPLMVLALTRTPLHELFPGVWTERNVTQINLGGLSRRASEQLVKSVLGDDYPAAQLDPIVVQAGGNAFYLEELVRAASEGRAERTPATVVAMAQARVEMLEPNARRLLRAASIFGATFWRGAVEALLGDDSATTDEAFEKLEARELIARSAVAKFPGETEYIFRHNLLRDAAHAMLTESDRCLAHRLAGSWLESMGESEAAVLAEHFAKGDEKPRAVRAYMSACDAALEANDLDAALQCSERGIACGAEGVERGALELVQAEVALWRGQLPAGERSARLAVELLKIGTARWYEAVACLVELCEGIGRPDEVTPLVEMLGQAEPEPQSEDAARLATARVLRGIALAGHHQASDALMGELESVADLDRADPLVAAEICMARGFRALFRGEHALTLENLREAIAFYQEVGHLRRACLQTSRLGFVKRELGLLEDARDELRSALAVAERLGLDKVAAHARNNLGSTLARLGELDEAAELEREAIALSRRRGDVRLEGGSMGYLSQILLMAGRLEEAERTAREAVERLRDAPTTQPLAQSFLAQTLLAQGKVEEARVVAARASGALESGRIEEGEAQIRLVWAEALMASGNHQQALHEIALARQRLLDRAGRIEGDELRQSFLFRVAENARTMELAQQWLDESR